MWSETSGEIAPEMLAQRLFSGYFGEGADISDTDEIRRILDDLNLSLVETVGASEKYVAALKERTQEALAEAFWVAFFHR